MILQLLMPRAGKGVRIWNTTDNDKRIKRSGKYGILLLLLYKYITHPSGTSLPLSLSPSLPQLLESERSREQLQQALQAIDHSQQNQPQQDALQDSLRHTEQEIARLERINRERVCIYMYRSWLLLIYEYCAL